MLLAAIDDPTATSRTRRRSGRARAAPRRLLAPGALLAPRSSPRSRSSRSTSTSARACSAATGATSRARSARGDGARAITTVELGAAPLEYYLPPLHNLARRASVRVSEIDETGYAPLRRGAGRPPAPGFRLVARRDVDGLIVYRFVSSVPRLVSEAELRRHVITLAHPEVLVPAGDRTSATAAIAGSLRPQMSSSDENI